MLLGDVGMLVIFFGIHVGFAMIALGEVLVGVTALFVVAAMMIVVRASVAKEYSGVASACLNASRQMGGVLGVTILGTVLGNQSLFLATQTALGIMLGVFLLGFVLILTSEGRWNGKH
jgi:DHA2 family methylenomycin A resistance protein-like MFS transporter